MHDGRMECLRLVLGYRGDGAAQLSTEEATKAVEAAEVLYAYACQGEERKPDERGGPQPAVVKAEPLSDYIG